MKLLYSKQIAQQKDINIQLRQLRKEKYMQNMEQKKIFQHLVRNDLQLDLKKSQHAKILADGIPGIYRELIWPQLMPNNHGITSKFYETLLKKVVKVSNQIIEANKNEQLKDLQLNKAKSQGYAPSQQINLNLQKISRWFETIKQDIPRTFSQLKIFQSYFQSSGLSENEREKISLNVQSIGLMNMLTCWAVYRDDIGYRQGMSQIAGFLLIQLNNQLKAFQIFCSLITTDTLYEFFSMNLEYISAFCIKVHSRLRQKNNQLHQFFDYNQMDYKLFILDWIFSLFTKCFQLDTVGKIWDLLLLRGMDQKIIINVIVQIICAFQKQILRFDNESQQIDSMEICRFLKKAKIDEIRQSKLLNNLKQLKY